VEITTRLQKGDGVIDVRQPVGRRNEQNRGHTAEIASNVATRVDRSRLAQRQQTNKQ
jgi:hypothetical protein